MKVKNKLLKDISTRLRSSNVESRKRSLKVLMRLRCFITSRSSGNYGKISLSRIKLRELVNNGLVLGFTKASW